MSCLYLVIVAVGSFLLAGLVMAQVDLYRLAGLNTLEIPVIEVPGSDIPEWALQLVLAVFIFLVVQPVVVILVGLFGRRSDKGEFAQPPPNPWEQ